MDTNAVMERLRRFEGSSDFMYRARDGEVTIGVGHRILNRLAAQQVRWHGEPTILMIVSDYDRVKCAPAGLSVDSYASLTRVRLDADTIETMLKADAERFTPTLMRLVPELEFYPESVQQALFDMGYTLGMSGLMKYKKLLAACRAGDWETAALESRQGGGGLRQELRNAEIGTLFASATLVSKS